MTTTTRLDPAASSLPTRAVLRRAVAAEWTRIWTVPSTWWSLGTAAAFAVLMGVTLGAEGVEEGFPLWVVGELVVSVAQLPLFIIVMLAVTADHATGAIAGSLQWVPRRRVLLTARLVVTVAIATVAGVLVTLLADASAWFSIGSVDAGELIESLGDVVVVLLVGAIVTFALAVVLRSTAGALTGAFLLLFALPILLQEFGVVWLDVIGRNLPGMVLTLLRALEGPGTAITDIAWVLVGWTVVPTVVAFLLFQRRDAV